jgi:hypothetical protein
MLPRTSSNLQNDIDITSNHLRDRFSFVGLNHIVLALKVAKIESKCVNRRDPSLKLRKTIFFQNFFRFWIESQNLITRNTNQNRNPFALLFASAFFLLTNVIS